MMASVFDSRLNRMETVDLFDFWVAEQFFRNHGSGGSTDFGRMPNPFSLDASVAG